MRMNFVSDSGFALLDPKAPSLSAKACKTFMAAIPIYLIK